MFSRETPLGPGAKKAGCFCRLDMLVLLALISLCPPCHVDVVDALVAIRAR